MIWRVDWNGKRRGLLVMNFYRAFLAAVISVVLGGAIPGCAGVGARNEILVPAVLLASGGVEADVASGVAVIEDEAQRETRAYVADLFFAAVRSRDRAAIATDALPRWPVVRGLAEDGIASRVQSGEISAGVAASLRERLRVYDEALIALSDRVSR